MNQLFDRTTKTGTAGGTLLAIFGISSEDLIKTAVLAAVGAVVSFGVTILCKLLFKRFRK